MALSLLWCELRCGAERVCVNLSFASPPPSENGFKIHYIFLSEIFEQHPFCQIASHNMSFWEQNSSLNVIIINFLNISSRLFSSYEDIS